MWTLANILDPVQDSLDQRVFDDTTPKPSIVKFITKVWDRNVEKLFNVKASDYFDLYLTGSLTTYQYSDASDCDVSVFPKYDALASLSGTDADTIRKELIKMNIDHLDGTFLPGGSHPLQFFACNVGQLPSDKFKEGERSAYNLRTGEWVVPPDKNISHDVQLDFPDVYQRAVDIGDKMTNMLDYDPKSARSLWLQVHKKRQHDQQADLGDFSEGNIVYKYLVHNGLVDRLRKELGLQIETKIKTALDYDEVRVLKFVIDTNTGSYRVTDRPMRYYDEPYHMHLMEEIAEENESQGYDPWHLEGVIAGYYMLEEGDNPINYEHTQPDTIVANGPPVQVIINAFKALGERPEVWLDGMNDSRTVISNVMDNLHMKVIYNPQEDHIILGTQADVQGGDVILGDYDGENVTLSSDHITWLNPNYFKRLWTYSFPNRELKKVHYDKGSEIIHLPTREASTSYEQAFVYVGPPYDEMLMGGSEHFDLINDFIGENFHPTSDDSDEQNDEFEEFQNNLINNVPMVFGHIGYDDGWNGIYHEDPHNVYALYSDFLAGVPQAGQLLDKVRRELINRYPDIEQQQFDSQGESWYGPN